jgi:hypothetical protein
MKTGVSTLSCQYADIKLPSRSTRPLLPLAATDAVAETCLCRHVATGGLSGSEVRALGPALRRLSTIDQPGRAFCGHIG